MNASKNTRVAQAMGDGAETMPNPPSKPQAEKKRVRTSPPNRFILAARAESELQRVEKVIANAHKRLKDAAERRKKLLDALTPEVRALVAPIAPPVAEAAPGGPGNG